MVVDDVVGIVLGDGGFDVVGVVVGYCWFGY